MRQEMSTVKGQLSATTEQISALTEPVRQSLLCKGEETDTVRQRPSSIGDKDTDQRGRRPLVPLENSIDDDYNVDSHRQPRKVCDDVLSLMPGQLERYSLLGSQTSCQSENQDLVCEKNDCFSKYIEQNEYLSENTQNVLQNMFGDDATTKSCTSRLDGLTLDACQIEILNNSWHIDNPENLTAYREDYRLLFHYMNLSVQCYQCQHLIT